MQGERLDWEHVHLASASVFDGRVSSVLRARGTSAARFRSIVPSRVAVKNVWTAAGRVGGRWGWDIPFLPLGILLGFFGVPHLVLAWGPFEREPWARSLGLVLGFLALLRFPLGTAPGIYTLWVLLPEPCGREYERLAQGGQMNSAVASL